MRSARLHRLQGILRHNELDFLVVVHLPNIRYLTGFTGSAGVLVIAEDGQSAFITDGRYAEQARKQVRGAKVVIARKPGLIAAAEWLRSRTRRRGAVRVGIEAPHMSIADGERLSDALSNRFRISNTTNLVERERMVKDSDEIALIRRAVLAGSSLFKTLLRTIKAGIPETSVAAEIEYAARKSGCDGMSFETIIASGKRSALPHGRASDQSIAHRAFVVCDFGVILAAYCSDMTRTLYVGRPDTKARSFYNAVRDAQLAAVEAVRPGIPVSEVDATARRVLKRAGLARYFTHSTGHGVGLEIHEAPRIAAGQSDILRPGMVITVEPGAYIPNVWGVRVEDMVLVTDRGHQVLTPTSKDLICI